MQLSRLLLAVAAALAAVSAQTTSQSVTPSSSPSTTLPSLASITASADQSSSISLTAKITPTFNSTTVTPTSSSQSTSITALPTDFFNQTGDANLNASSANRPPLTPALVIAGLIFMITGGAYCVIGVKNRYQQVFLSTAYLTSLAVVVLIVYVINPPIPNAIQGAYLVAVVVTGLISGALAIVFIEVAEGLGALLGGFCISMWFLCLAPGGLIQNDAGKTVFIAALTVGMFGITFSRHTRHYGLIVGTAFAGATIFILGIDCFARTGLKEFWLYIWNLNNDKLFGLKANTFGQTKGLRVLLAAIIFIFAVGIISQIELWRIIYKRRQKRAEARRADEEKAEAAERKAARRLEREAAKEQDQEQGPEPGHWDLPLIKGPVVHEKADSGIGSSSSFDGEHSKEQSIEMSDLNARIAEKSIYSDTHLSPRASQVGSGAITPASENRLSAASIAASPSVPAPPPVLIPLPHNPPAAEEEEDDASSLATAATDEAGSRRNSIRDSRGSLASWRKRLSKRTSKQREVDETPILVPHIEDDQASSIAATLDGMTDRDEIQTVYSPLASPIAASFKEVPDITKVSDTMRVVPVDDQMVTTEASDIIPEKRHSIANLLFSEPKEPEAKRLSLALPSLTGGSSFFTGDLFTPEKQKRRAPAREDPEPEADMAPGILTKPLSKPTPLTTAALRSRSRSRSRTRQTARSTTGSAHSLSEQLANERVSKVVMSYRTNEWAKHLEDAEMPDAESEKFEYPPDKVVEKPIPVIVETLQPASTIITESRPASTTQSHPATSHQTEVESRSPLTERHSTVLRTPSSSSFHFPPVPASQSQPLGFKPTLEPLRAPSAASVYESPLEIAPASQPFYSGRTVSAMGTTSVPGQAMPAMIRPGSSVGHSRPGSRDITRRTPSMDIVPGVMAPPALYNGGIYNGSTPLLIQQQYVGTELQQPPVLSRKVSANTSTPNLMSGRSSSASMYRNDDRYNSFTGMHDHQAAIAQMQLQLQAQQALLAQQHQVIAGNTNNRSASAMSNREAKLASFRESLASDLKKSKLSSDHVDTRRVELLMERQQKLEAARANQSSRQQRDSAIDEMMRRDDMIELHREAMRRMQQQVGQGGKP